MDKTYLEQYHEAIERKEIIVGGEMKKELRKLIRDLDNGKYQYDVTESHNRMLFMETLCLQSKKPFYNKPMELLLWEQAFIESMYSFRKYDDELGRWRRRFRNVLLLIARKNGKTTLLAGDAHTDLRIGDGGQDIVCTSNDEKQANLLWGEVGGMRQRIDPKSKWTHQNLSEIQNLSNGTKIFKMSSKTQNKDGRNIDKTYFDESHDAQNDEIAVACKKSMSVKEEPLFINLTTNGFVNDGYLDNELVYARKVLNDEIDDDEYLPWLYTQDSEQEIWQDESSWYKSNPSLGVIKKWSYLRKRSRNRNRQINPHAYVVQGFQYKAKQRASVVDGIRLQLRDAGFRFGGFPRRDLHWRGRFVRHNRFVQRKNSIDETGRQNQICVFALLDTGKQIDRFRR